jgi:BrnA antitoxin of type II toxin-antitoxin system
MKKRWVDPDDGPTITGEEIDLPDARWRIGGRVVPADEGKAAMRVVLRKKTRVNIHLDSDLIAHYKALAPEGGYQTLINAALRRDMEGNDLKAAIVRELKERTEEVRQEIRALEESFVQIRQSDQMQSVVGIYWEALEKGSPAGASLTLGGGQSLVYSYPRPPGEDYGFSGTAIEGNILDRFMLMTNGVINSGARLNTQLVMVPSVGERTAHKAELASPVKAAVEKRRQHV